MAIPGTSKLWEESEARSSDGDGHRAVAMSMVPQRTLHLGQDKPIDSLTRYMLVAGPAGQDTAGFPRPPKGSDFREDVLGCVMAYASQLSER